MPTQLIRFRPNLLHNFGEILFGWVYGLLSEIRQRKWNRVPGYVNFIQFTISISFRFGIFCAIVHLLLLLPCFCLFCLRELLAHNKTFIVKYEIEQTKILNSRIECKEITFIKLYRKFVKFSVLRGMFKNSSIKFTKDLKISGTRRYLNLLPNFWMTPKSVPRFRARLRLRCKDFLEIQKYLEFG